MGGAPPLPHVFAPQGGKMGRFLAPQGPKTTAHNDPARIKREHLSRSTPVGWIDVMETRSKNRPQDRIDVALWRERIMRDKPLCCARWVSPGGPIQ